VPLFILQKGTSRCPWFFQAHPDATIRLVGASIFREYKSDFYSIKPTAEMADFQEKRSRGRPPKLKKFRDIAFQLPEGHYEYLRDLVRVKRLLGERCGPLYRNP